MRDDQAVIREWRREDIPRIMELMIQVAEHIDYEMHSGPMSAEAQFAVMAGLPDVYKSYVLERDGRILGFISLVYYRSILHLKGTALINELVIDASERGKGYGERLLNFAIEEARAGGWDEIEVGVESFNKGAIAFYMRNGLDQEYTLLGKEFT